jgi:hypothetical protein
MKMVSSLLNPLVAMFASLWSSRSPKKQHASPTQQQHLLNVSSSCSRHMTQQQHQRDIEAGAIQPLQLPVQLPTTGPASNINRIYHQHDGDPFNRRPGAMVPNNYYSNTANHNTAISENTDMDISTSGSLAIAQLPTFPDPLLSNSSIRSGNLATDLIMESSNTFVTSTRTTRSGPITKVISATIQEPKLLHP